jgi:hypothetical protein
MNYQDKQLFWKFYIKFKKYIKLVAEVSSFIMLLISFEQAWILKTWSVIKPWQLARLAEKFPKLLRTLQVTFSVA